MVASNETIAQCREVILRHMTLDAAERLLAELAAVPGNKSFRETLRILHTNVRARIAARGPAPVEGGPGWQRMNARLGPARMESMRQDVLQGQRDALAEAAAKAPPDAASRRGGPDYPPSAAPKRRRRR